MFRTGASSYALGIKARCMDALIADKERHRFLVGTCSLQSEKNQIQVLEYDTDANEIKCVAVYFHEDEIYDLVPSPFQKDLVWTCSRKGKDKKATLFKMKDIDSSSDSNTSPHGLVSLAQLPSSNVRRVTWNQCLDQEKEPLEIVSAGQNRLSTWNLDGSSYSIQHKDTMEVGPLDQEINRVVWDPHHPKYISCASGNNIYTWDTRAKSIAYSIEETHLNSVLDMDYNPNKPYCIVTGGDEGKMKFWDLRSPQKPLLNLNAHTHWVWSVRYNRFHDQLVLSSSSDTLLSLWRVSSISSAPIVELDELETASADVADTKIRSYEEHEDSIYSIAWGSSDSWLFGALSNDGCFTINLVPSTEKYKILL